MCAQRAGDVLKARLPQYGIVEQSLDQNDLGAVPDLLPCIQATLGARQEAMREGGADAAAIQVDDVLALAQREDDALIESIGALRVEQSDLPQQIEGMTLCREMTAQTSAGGITDPQFPDQGRIMHSAPVEIAHRLGVVIQLLLIESGSLFEHRAGIRLQEWSADPGRRGSGGRTDGGTTGESESGLRPARSRGSRKHPCAC